MASVKQGLLDIKMVLEEGHFKLFLKPLAVVVAIVIIYHYVSGMLAAQDAKVLGQIDAVHAQQNNEQEYVSNKQKLLSLEPRFPDMSAKNSWLLNQVVNVSNETSVQLKAGQQVEDTSNNGYTGVSVPVDMVISYDDLGKLLANIEGREEFLKVSEFSLTKAANNLGNNNVKMRIHTVFPTEKVTQTLFKNKPAKGGKK